MICELQYPGTHQPIVLQLNHFHLVVLVVVVVVVVVVVMVHNHNVPVRIANQLKANGPSRSQPVHVVTAAVVTNQRKETGKGRHLRHGSCGLSDYLAVASARQSISRVRLLRPEILASRCQCWVRCAQSKMSMPRNRPWYKQSECAPVAQRSGFQFYATAMEK